MLAINPPDFLIPSIEPTDVIIAGQSIYFECPEGQMLPFEVDQDSNFQLEVICIDGIFQPPVWPNQCQVELVCRDLPEPPQDPEIKFVRSDNRTKYRNEEQAYFTCEDPTALIDDDSGLNTIGIVCQIEGATLAFPADFEWPNCVKVTQCKDLPEPSAESGLMKHPKIGETVRVGEFVRYTCKEKDNFYETPDVRVFAFINAFNLFCLKQLILSTFFV